MNVAVIDDHPVIHDAVETYISLRRVDSQTKCFSSIAEFSQAISGSDYRPDLVLLDLGLPGFTEIEALENFKSQYADLTVVVFSAQDTPDMMRKVLAAGASGFIPKSAKLSLLTAALDLVLAGGQYFPKETFMETAIGRSADLKTQYQSAPPSLRGLLTLRQNQILELVAAGSPNKIICRELALSETTVKNHLAVVMRVLGASNRTEAVRIGREKGLLK